MKFSHVRLPWANVDSIVLAAPVFSPHGTLAMYGLEDSHPTRDEVSVFLTEEFVSFIEAVRSLALGPNSPYETLPFAFRAGTAAHRLLEAPPVPRAWGGAWLALEKCRLATLLHVHFIVLDMQESPELTTQYVRHFQKIQGAEIFWENSVELLHHLVVKHETDVRLDNPDRSWRVLRIMETALKLSRSSYHIFRNFLFNCLSNRITSEQWHLSLYWDPARVREELLSEFAKP